jgi:hypothetical protein
MSGLDECFWRDVRLAIASYCVINAPEDSGSWTATMAEVSQFSYPAAVCSNVTHVYSLSWCTDVFYDVICVHSGVCVLGR